MARRAEVQRQLHFVLAYPRLEAAACMGISAGLFDRLVRDGTFPKPRVIGGRKIWAVDELQAALKGLPRESDDAEEVDTWADLDGK